MRDLGRLRRSVGDRKIAGVAGGIARHLDIDPTLVRVLLVVLIFFGGAGLLLYGAVWLLVPEDGSENAPITTAPGTRNILLLVTGAIALLLLVGDSWSGWGLGWGPGWPPPWPLLLIAVIVAAVLLARDDRRPTDTRGPVTPPPAVGAPPPPAVGAPPPPAVGAPPPPAVGAPPPPPPRLARPDRGPSLWWPTVALLALALGILGLVEVGGGYAVDPAAYAALALAVVGAMMVLGAWVGRTGSLVVLGLVALAALALSATLPRLSAGDLERDPLSAAQVESSYQIGVGRVDLDLTGVRDLDTLDGRRVELETFAGELLVTVPDGLDVNVHAEASGGGQINLLGELHEGDNLVVYRHLDGGPDAPTIDLYLDTVFGRVEVRQR